ncbi:MAG TPA: CDP-alcohol phosphatidyltransferase family protein [Gemmatimonadaceae bacterium]|nr:CDP-alcohol phosphatidyltransferase family protein [Acidimicrobiia bacterium]
MVTLVPRPPAEFTTHQRRGWYYSATLTLVRVALAPVLIAANAHGSAGSLLALVVVLAFVSDIFDGVVARRVEAVTAELRRADSLADTVFYLAVAWVMWRTYWDVLSKYRWAIIAVLVGEGLNYAAAMLKFRRVASYHARSARWSGVALALAIVLLFARHSAAIVPVALIVSIVAQTESIAITLILRESRTDVRSAWVAWHHRRASGSMSPGVPCERPRHE